jgi:very-short-patch-repair endonuclease
MINLIHKTPIPTPETLLLKEALEKLNVDVRIEVFDGHKHIDLMLPKAKLDIEVDGKHHLTNPKQILADLNRDFYSHKDGFGTMHIPNRMIHVHLKEISEALAEVSRMREGKIKGIDIHIN